MNTVFAGRTALVVGGTGGIGAAVARALARRGARLIVHGGASQARLERTIGELREAGAAADGFLLAVESPREAGELFARAPDADIVICAWGPFARAGLAATSAADWERAALLDLALPGAIASAFLPGMASRGYGRFLFFGGTATDSVRGFATTAAYSAAKTGIGVLAKSIAIEYAGTGVSAVAVCPGFVDTEYLTDRIRDSLRVGAPGGRLLEADSLAETAVSLIGTDMANGAVVPLDAGLDLGRRRRM